MKARCMKLVDLGDGVTIDLRFRVQSAGGTASPHRADGRAVRPPGRQLPA